MWSGSVISRAVRRHGGPGAVPGGGSGPGGVAQSPLCDHWLPKALDYVAIVRSDRAARPLRVSGVQAHMTARPAQPQLISVHRSVHELRSSRTYSAPYAPQEPVMCQVAGHVGVGVPATDQKTTIALARPRSRIALHESVGSPGKVAMSAR